MNAQRSPSLIITIQSALLLACLISIGVLLWHNYVLKLEAENYASAAGSEEARRSFLRGDLWLYEAKPYKFSADDSGPVPTDGDIEPAGKMDGQFQVYYMLVNEDLPKVYREIQQSYIDAYNQHMHLCLAHPEWFKKDRLRIPSGQLKGQTNAAGSSN
jgi:hypothetical protein